MGSQSATTRDHEKIRQWVEERDGKPAVVKDTESRGDGTGLLRIRFDDAENDLQDIEWQEFFDTFDDKDLTFLYQESIDGSQSRFFKFVRD